MCNSSMFPILLPPLYLPPKFRSDQTLIPTWAITKQQPSNFGTLSSRDIRNNFLSNNKWPTKVDGDEKRLINEDEWRMIASNG
uniref:Uncharacterized protein n=1 Tax=Cucumis sativus TaxID=3659 RepID=A0A0A0LL96_CUCSA